MPIAAGLLWLCAVAPSGAAALLIAALPGGLLLGSGVAMLLWAGDLRIPQYGALGGLAGVLLAPLALFVVGAGGALVLGATSAASFVAAGVNALRREPSHDDVPDPRPSLPLAAKVATDDALIAGVVLTIPMPRDPDAQRLRGEVEAALELYQQRGWLDSPALYHASPPELSSPDIREREVRGLRFEHLRFASEYEPDPAEPGGDRLLTFAANRHCHAWVMRHPDGPRRWLVCVHGYAMGSAAIDLRVFGADYLHGGLGLNLIFPVLPHHGLRSSGGRSGRQFLTVDFIDSLHAQAQAVWDIRRLFGWARSQGARRLGVYGLSMGGHVAALLASVDGELDCAVAGIPVTDLVRIAWRHGPPLQIGRFEELGLLRKDVERLLRVVSPLALEPRVPHRGRFLFGGTADRLVPPDHVRDLWNHWERPRLVWYEGSHLSFFREPKVRGLLHDAFLQSLVEPA